MRYWGDLCLQSGMEGVCQGCLRSDVEQSTGLFLDVTPLYSAVVDPVVGWDLVAHPEVLGRGKRSNFLSNPPEWM